jgi:hypothetical protein
VYSRHQELKQASKQASKQALQPIHELLVATEAVGEFFEIRHVFFFYPQLLCNGLHAAFHTLTWCVRHRALSADV